MDSYSPKIALILTVGFAFASLLGYISNRAKLSPLLGYLLAGYLIGPYSPGFVADLQVSEQLAEIGVILMMFGVGLHFKLEDLLNVKYIAIPGAFGQTFIASSVGAFFIYSIGWTLEAGIIFGLGIGVASTVVLVRELTENRLLHTQQGHIAMGWLIVEDLITVAALIMIPTLALSATGGDVSISGVVQSLLVVLLKFIFLALIMFTLGQRFVTFALSQIVYTRSQELFTVTLLALIFVIATGSAYLFGTSIALGAFIAGMVIGQTEVRRRVSSNSMPLKDAFVVVFFLSVGMLFDPMAIKKHFLLFLGTVAIILILKPLAAYVISLALKYPHKTALTIAIALAQIGEFSFILAEEAMRFHIFPEDGFDLIVASAFLTISINPLLFKLLKT